MIELKRHSSRRCGDLATGSSTKETSSGALGESAVMGPSDRARCRWMPRSGCAAARSLTAAALSEGWATWIDHAAEWQWFTTHTFKEDVSPHVALALYDRWLGRLAEACRQESRCPPELQAACAVEWTHARRVHLHSVIAGRGLSRLRMLRWQHRWEDLARCCGMARVFSAKDRASAYLSKYCGKGGVVVVRGRFGGWHASHKREAQGRTSRKPR